MSGLINRIVSKSFIPAFTATRAFSVTSANRLKQIDVVRDEQKQSITIESKIVASPNESLLVKELADCKKDGKQFCPECTLGLNITHTDVLILSQYVRPDGCMLPRRVTGLCKRQQKRIRAMVTMAQKAGLMMNLTPYWSKKDPKKRYGLKAFNTYFYEETIKLGDRRRKIC